MCAQWRKQIRNKKRLRSRRGIALVFTLGILGLLTVLALGFASTAMISRKVAYNTANVTTAQMLAQSALERVRLALFKGIPENMIYSRPASGNIDYDWLWKLHTDLDGVNLYTFPDNYSSSTSGLPAWQYVKGTKGEIIGRFAYVVKTEKGKLDPSVHYGEKIFPLNPDNDYETPAGPADSLLRKGKSEAEIDFFNFKPAVDILTTNKKMTMLNEIKARSDGSAGAEGYLHRYGRFAELSDLANKLEVTDTAEKAKLYNVFEFCSSPDPEAFWLDRNGNGKIEREEFYHRFNLGARLPYTRDANGMITASQWDNMKIDDLLADTKLYSESVVSVNASNVTEPVTGGIPWLKNWKYNPSETEPSNEWNDDLVKKQIAANIIQYCRSESSPTVTDLADDADWIADPGPAVAGIGRHPFVNEVGVALSVMPNVTPIPNSDGSTSYSLQYSFEFNCGVELIDMFHIASLSDKTIKIKVLGSYSFKYWNPEKGKYEEYTDGKIELNLDSSTSSANTLTWSDGYSSFWLEKLNSSFVLPVAPVVFTVTDVASVDDVPARISDIRFYVKKVVVEYDGKQRDFAYVSAGKSEKETPVFIFEGKQAFDLKANTNHIFVTAWQTDDPRVNHYSSDWKRTDKYDDKADYKSVYDTAGTPGKVNSTVTCENSNETIQDIEMRTDPAAKSATARISTAYIRHAPMESLWELGAISRAEKWKTLNLTKTDTTNSKLGQADGGGGKYADGDGAILDQVKLTSKIASYGKINLNTDSHGVLHALFAGIKTGADALYSDYRRGTDYPLMEHDAVVETNDCLLCKIASISSHTPLKTRAELLAGDQNHADANVRSLLGVISAKLVNPSVQTDAEREQIIGKVINLTKAESTNEINVVILAQTIKDIGPESGAITIQKYWGSNDNQRYRRAGYLRAPRQTESNPKWTKLTLPSGFSLAESASITGKARGTYKNGADLITGEAKLVVIMYKNNGVWKIRRYEYAE